MTDLQTIALVFALLIGMAVAVGVVLNWGNWRE